MHPNLVVLFLSLFLGTQPVTTDLYLPALPAITHGFGASMPQAQLTLTAMLLAFGTSQLLWGPLSDKYGRRPVLIFGMAAYSAASLGSVLAANIEALIFWRLLLGLALGAAITCARAMVRDLYEPVAGARVMSKGLTGLGLIACLSAPVGGMLSDALGWRTAMLALTVFGMATLVLVIFKFKETLQKPNPRALQPGNMFATWKTIAHNPAFWAYAALVATTYGGLFTFLASSSFIFVQVLHLTTMQYGFLIPMISVFYIGGTFICRRLLQRVGVVRTVWVGGFFTLTGGVSIAALAFAGVHTVWAIMLPFCIFMIGHGVHQPCGQSGCVGPFPQAAGAAAALAGFVMMVVAFAMGGWIGTHMDGTVYPLAYGVAFWSVLIVLTAWVLVQRYGEPKKV